MKIVLLGSGNVATHLGKALQASGHKIVEVWSRTLAHAEELGKLLNCCFTDQLSAIHPQADIYILSVSDQAIKTVASQFPFAHKILIHTSGATDLEIANISGVFYPVQTFSKFKAVDFSLVPIVVEAREPLTISTLISLANSISLTVTPLNSVQRKALHVAAVFASNFTNHLYAIAQEILKSNQLDFALIKPLILETAEKVQHLSPPLSQTGPANRNDQITIQHHLEFLNSNPHLKEIYHVLSQSIINLHQKA